MCRCCWSVIAAALVGVGVPAVSAELRPERPNLILFLVDDLGWQDLSVPLHTSVTPFNRHFRTPHVERLARQGVRFTQAYACAVCSPTRTSIMTGQNAARHGVTNWTLHRDGETSQRTDRLGPPANWHRNGLQPGSPTLASLLRDAGYRTIHVGKAHWGAYDTPGSDPTNLGFNVNIAGHAAGGPGHYHGTENYGNKLAGTHTRPWGVPSLEAYHGSATHLTDALTQEACSAVRQAVQEQTPFFLYLAHYAVHAPIQEHAPYVDHYRGKRYAETEIEIPEAEARYASMVEGMDASLGAVLELLAELEVAEQTLIVFASDNGGLSAHARGTTPRGTATNTHCWPLREGKGSAYEGGTRVPLVVSWASRDETAAGQRRVPITADSICREQVICEDLAPTLLGWSQVEDWQRRLVDVDGRDMHGLVTGESQVGVARPLVFHYPHVWGPRNGPGYRPHSAIRIGDWKAIYFYHRQDWELYDLANDLGEAHDLAASRPRKLGELATALQSELDRLGGQFPVNLQTGDAEPLRLPSG